MPRMSAFALIHIKAVKERSHKVSLGLAAETPESERPVTEPKAPRHLFGSNPGRFALAACENSGT